MSRCHPCGPIAQSTASSCEAAAIHEEWLRSRAGEYSERLRYRLALATTLKSMDYIRALRRRRELCQEFATAMEDIDLLVTTMSGDEAGPLDEMSLWDGLLGLNFAAPWNLTGYPAMSVCTGFGRTGCLWRCRSAVNPSPKPLCCAPRICWSE